MKESVLVHKKIDEALSISIPLWKILGTSVQLLGQSVPAEVI